MKSPKLVVLVTAGLVACNIALALALIYTTVRRPIYYVGKVSEGTSRPDDPPAHVFRDFCLSFLSAYDNYTPATIERNSQQVLRLASARSYSQVAGVLAQRETLVTQGKISSLLTLDPDSFSLTRLSTEVTARSCKAASRATCPTSSAGRRKSNTC